MISCFNDMPRTPMLEQYFSIKEQHKDALLFFHLGDFFEMFGDDAIEASRILDLTLTARGKGTDNEVPMCGVPLRASSAYISKLTQAGKKVALCEQVSEPDGKTLVKREVTKIVTPGTTFDDSVLDNKQNNFLCAITAQGTGFAIAVVDATTGRFQVGEYSDQGSVIEEVYRISPSEIIVSNIEEDLKSQLSKTAFVDEFALPSWQPAEKVITEHFQTLGLDSFGLNDSGLLQAVTAQIIGYLQETQKSALGHIRNVEIRQPDSYMLLDESTIRNLELFANQYTGQVNGSLVETIDETNTAMGGRLLRWWLSRPLIDQDRINQRLEVVDLFVKHPNLTDQVRESLNKMCDLERLVGKVGTLRVNPRDLHNLKETITQIPAIKELLHKHSGIKMIGDLLSKLHIHQDLVSMINEVLIDEPPVLLADGGYIREGYNKELDELRGLATSGKEWISNLQDKERKRTGINSMKVKFNKVFGYYIEVSKSNLSAVPDDYIRKQTLVNAERYTTPELKEYEEKVLGAQDKILQLEQELFSQLRERVYEHVATMQETARALAVLDVLSSFAYLAVSRHYNRPEICPNVGLEVKDGRHPVIEHIQNEPYIANDLSINADQAFILLTGPNMSGKSSFLRQNALLVLLAQIGCFVPAKSMKWSIVDRIFTRVGASDNLASGRSTFMVEMQEAAYILNNATDRSLVILDELGRGTSTYDGLSLAWAITEYLHDVIKAKTLFATHYHELIEIIDDLPRAKNFSVAVAEKGEEVVFLHQVQEGGVNRSYGIEVGKLAGLPNDLIVRAKDILSRLEQHAWEKDSAERQKTLPMMPSKQTEHPAVKKLKEIDPDNMTPLQALEALSGLKSDVED